MDSLLNNNVPIRNDGQTVALNEKQSNIKHCYNKKHNYLYL